MQTEMNREVLLNRRMPGLPGIGSTAFSLEISSIYDTLDNSLTDIVWVNPHFMNALSFTTGSNRCTLKSIIIGMMGNVAKNSGGFTVSIYDASGPGRGPGDSMAMPLIGSNNPTSGSNEYYGEIELDPHRTYWVVARVAKGGGTYGWITGSDSPIGSDIGCTENFTFQREWLKPDSSARLNLKVNVVDYVMDSKPKIHMDFGIRSKRTTTQPMHLRVT